MNRGREDPVPELFRTGDYLPEAIHHYRDESGAMVGVIARFAPGTLDPDKKSFRAFRYEGDRWHPGLNGMRLPLYNLAGVTNAVKGGRTVYVPEGEGCVDLLSRWMLPATTNAFGAGKWESRFASHFADIDLVLLPDRDAPGRKHMEQVAASLYGVAKSVRVLDLPGLANGEDIVDWERAGGTPEALVELALRAPVWTPPAHVHEQWERPITFGASEEAEPFPIEDGLPPLLRELSTQTAETIKVDPTAPATLAAVAVSASAGNAYRVRVSEAHVESNLGRFSAWASPSGERKTSTFATIVRPFDNWMRDEEPDYRRRRADAQAEASFYKKKAEHAESRGAKATDPEKAAEWLERAREARAKIPVPPRRPIAYVGDTTPEALVRQMAACGGASAVMSGEARHTADALMGRHRKDGATDDSVYLRAHGGDRIDRSRIGNSSEGEFLGIDRPSLALAICLQPDKFDQLAGRRELIESGLLPRCNIIRPRSLVGERIESGEERPIDPSVANEWETTLRAILAERYRLIDSAIAGLWEPIELCLDPEAMDLRRIFANEIETRQLPSGDLHGTGGFASKAAGEAARLAGLYHLVDLVRRGCLWKAASIQIPAATWALAERAQRFHLAESLRVLSLALEDTQQRLGRRVLDWISRKPTERAVLEARHLIASRIVASAEEAEQLFTWLEERRWVRKVDPGKGKWAGRWEVHPIVLREAKR